MHPINVRRDARVKTAYGFPASHLHDLQQDIFVLHYSDLSPPLLCLVQSSAFSLASALYLFVLIIIKVTNLSLL